MSQLDTCSWVGKKPPFFNATFIVDWPIWEIEYIHVYIICGILKGLLNYFQAHAACVIKYMYHLYFLTGLFLVILTPSIPSSLPNISVSNVDTGYSDQTNTLLSFQSNVVTLVATNDSVGY